MLRFETPPFEITGAFYSMHATFPCPFSDKSKARNSSDSKKEPGIPKEPSAHIAAQTFTFRDLAAATKNFRPECLLGEGGFGRVYKGKLESGQVCLIPCKSNNQIITLMSFILL